MQKILFLIPFICVAIGIGAAEFQAGIDAGAGGTYRMFTQGMDPVTLSVWASSANGKDQTISLKLSAVDFLGKTARWEKQVEIQAPANGAKTKQEISLEAGPGYFSIQAEFSTATEKLERWTDLGVIPPPHPGLRPDSFFASNTSGLKTGIELKLLQMIGMKVQRVHFQPSLAAKPPAKPAGPLALNFKEQDKRWAASKEAGIWALPIAGYSFEGTLSEQATQIQMYGPPRDFEEFVSTWEQILKHYPELTTCEFWNEPWIYGWTWAANGEEYRKLQKMWCEMALKVNPKYRILAGNSSMFCEDHIEPDPACYKGLLQGTTHHPYSFSTGASSFRAGDTGRSTDHGMNVTNRMGLPFYYLTEGGTEYNATETQETLLLRKKLAALQSEMKGIKKEEQKSDKFLALKKEQEEIDSALAAVPSPKNNVANAAKVVQYYVRAALCGAFQGNVQWDIGYGPQWTRSNTSFAVMTHFLEDRPVVADIWPEHELIWGAVFANPPWINDAVKALPRAKELGARWNVAAGDGTDKTKVAVLWSWTGQSNEMIDRDGVLTIDNVGDLKAYDLYGREIPAEGNLLKIPFNGNPVYITSDALDIVDFHKRIATAKIENVTPLNLYALSLTQPATEAQSLRVRVENQMNREIEGTLTLKTQTAQMKSDKFKIVAGKLAEVSVQWPACALSPQNQYSVTLIANTDAGISAHMQTLAVARFVKRSITIDGSLDDWAGVVPAGVDSAGTSNEIDPTQYLLNPNMKRPEQTDNKHVAAWVYTAYDNDYVYLAVAVNQDQLACSAGEPAMRGRGEKVPLPYKNGVPDGVGHIRNCGDVFMFSFGFRERVPGWGRQMDDPYAWKGHFYDTDYHYAAHISKDGDRLIRLWGADTTRHTAYQTEVVPGVAPVPGAKIAIKRDEAKKLSIYEMAIPRRELALFDPASGRCRFGFILANNEKAGPQGELQWADAAGVFDYWRSAGSFSPSWMQVLPCQTYFGIEK